MDQDTFQPRITGQLLIRAADRSKEAFAAAVERCGLTATQARTVFTLHKPRPMRELAAEMACDASNITGIADRLERQGLIERVPGADRRVKLLTLTDQGQRVRRELAHAVQASPFPMDALTEAEQRELQRLLHKLLGD
ncbi:MarR family winged helix-turn-helix transcriptional regulator [Enemella dayhoffiae]|nr:MarR family transcriptional regulator [Enemella dayhoffiae]